MGSKHSIFKPLLELSAITDLLKHPEAGEPWRFPALHSAGQPAFAALLHRHLPERPLLVVTDGLKTQERFLQDLTTWLQLSAPNPKTPGKPPLFFPAWEVLPHESKLPHADVISERLETLVALQASETDQATPVVVTSLQALLQRTFRPGFIGQRTRMLRQGDSIEPLDLVEWLEEQGYEPEAQVNHKGEIALRGGILDVYPLTSPWPVRLEFFGAELESLRHFDPVSQVSRENIAEISLPPAGEFGLLKKLVAEAPTGSPNPLGTLLDYFPAGTLCLLCDAPILSERAAHYAEQIPSGDPFFIGWDDVLERLAASDGSGKTAFVRIEVAEEESSVETVDDPAGGLHLESLEAFRPLTTPPEPHIAEAQRREFFAQLHRWGRQDYCVHVVCNNEGERQRFTEIWNEYGLGPIEENLRVHLGALSRGFLSHAARLVVVTDAEIFGRYKVQRPRRLKSAHAAASRSALDIDFTELEEGDFVVHLQYGIGRYVGLKLMPAASGRKATKSSGAVADAGQECLVIEYASGDPEQPAPRLFVPVTEAHLVSKYVGAGKARPQLNTLGGTRWTKAKAQAEHAVRDLAAELLTIQAAREAETGFAAAPDQAWQREFESSFLYEETPDQMRAINETKQDMERPRPMDRLICGDVGYGKTEVAIRAAFKAVMNGKQVAVLVPTTVLAQQHFNTFRERMADYPVRVEVLSRYRTAREQRKVIAQLESGEVDIVIGTHRLVQSDINFKDLGLVVIDEEQRFGVLHKEKFKLLRKMVDVLTLSATPIPRTLYLALTGARDMSTIETPPQDRLPVETIVTQYDERIVRDAIQRELNREGQVFYLHNRVMDIEAVALRLKALVPDARFVVGHGQMDPDELERVMTAFVNGEADVLLSTTIIESGIDIPNANTIIIDRADRFGLSDLYQLRGRVGRYKHQAYAYLLLPRHAGLLTDARKRISAIKQYSSLGSGFKIAMRDLEIRGAGNLLGSQQSGHITAVGFELYCQLLKQSVSALKGEPVQQRLEVAVRLDFVALDPAEEIAPPPETPSKPVKELPEVSIPREGARYRHHDADFVLAEEEEEQVIPRAPAYIPLTYVAAPKQRIEVYRKLAQATDKAAMEALRKELRDRFGPLPKPVDLLFQITELKLLARDRGVTSIEVRESKLMITRHRDLVMLDGRFPRLTKPTAEGRLKEIKKLLLAF